VRSSTRSGTFNSAIKLNSLPTCPGQPCAKFAVRRFVPMRSVIMRHKDGNSSPGGQNSLSGFSLFRAFEAGLPGKAAKDFFFFFFVFFFYFFVQRANLPTSFANHERTPPLGDFQRNEHQRKQKTSIGGLSNLCQTPNVFRFGSFYFQSQLWQISPTTRRRSHRAGLPPLAMSGGVQIVSSLQSKINY